MLARGEQADEDELLAHARTAWPRSSCPSPSTSVDELPSNQSGKLLKRVLRDDLAGTGAS